MKSILLIATLLLHATTGQADAIDQRVERALARGHVPGAAIAVVEDGRIRKIAAYGKANLEWDIDVDEDTSFQLASATKIFTGIALMRLVEQGRLTLDAPLTRFFPDAPATWSRIRVRQLADHTSGLSDDLGQPRPQTVAAIVAAAQAKPLAYEPGSESRYGFTDFVVLRAILEQVSGKALPALFRDEIFLPLGLHNPRFAHARSEGPSIRSADLVPRRATIHAWKDGRQRVSDFLYGEQGYGAGGLHASIRDLAAVFVAIDKGRLLKPESWTTLQTPPVLADGKRGGFGIGWTTRTYRGTRVIGHSGGPALADILRVDARKLTIIALTNQQRYYPLLAEAVADLYLPPASRKATERDTRPGLTEAMRQALSDAAGAKVDKTRFVAAGAAQTIGFLGDFGAALLEALGPIRRVDLVADAQNGDRIERTYRIEFEERPMHWRLIASDDGLIEALHPVGEGD